MDRRTAGLRGGVVVLGLTATLATAGSALAATGEESPGPPTATTSAPAARHQTEPRGHRAAPARPQSPAAALRASDQSPPAAARVAGARSRGPSVVTSRPSTVTSWSEPTATEPQHLVSFPYISPWWRSLSLRGEDYSRHDP